MHDVSEPMRVPRESPTIPGPDWTRGACGNCRYLHYSVPVMLPRSCLRPARSGHKRRRCTASRVRRPWGYYGSARSISDASYWAKSMPMTRPEATPPDTSLSSTNSLRHGLPGASRDAWPPRDESLAR